MKIRANEMNVEALLDQIRNRIRLIVGRAVITACKMKDGEIISDVELTAGEKRRGIEFMQQFGFTSVPTGECSGIVLFVGGNRDNAIGVASRGDDSEMRLNLSAGETAMHSPYGQSIIMRKDGNVEIVVNAGKKIIYTSDTFEISGNLNVGGEVTAMAASAATKVTLSKHIHPTGTGPSGKPTQGI